MGLHLPWCFMMCCSQLALDNPHELGGFGGVPGPHTKGPRLYVPQPTHPGLQAE